MNIRLIATIVIAALLTTGTGVAVPALTTAEITPPAATEPAQTPVVTEPAVTLLTREEARDIALAHAELTAEQVSRLKVSKDREDGVLVWEVEFFFGNVEYEYEIHAGTGAVLRLEKEEKTPKPPKNDPTEPAATAPAVTEPVAPPVETPKALTADEAGVIALNHAGLTAEQVLCLKVRADREDGVSVWDVEFHFENVEYDYEIHAQTGQILKAEKETDDDPCDAHKNHEKHGHTHGNGHQQEPTEEQPVTLTAREAKDIALNHAGLTAEQVKRVKAEKDREDGVLIWEIEFRFEGVEYEYEIDAQTGAILHSEKELDD